jgi:hypothetical protein
LVLGCFTQHQTGPGPVSHMGVHAAASETYVRSLIVLSLCHSLFSDAHKLKTLNYYLASQVALASQSDLEYPSL